MVSRSSVLALVLMVGAMVSAGASEVGERAPEIQAQGWYNTEKLSLAQLRDKVVVVEFWATWCGPCMRSIPHLVELHGQYKDKGVVIIGFTNESKDYIKPTVERMGMNYAVAAGSRTANAYGVEGIPCAFVVAPGGKIVWKGHPSFGLDEAIAQAVQKYSPTTVARK